MARRLMWSSVGLAVWISSATLAIGPTNANFDEGLTDWNTNGNVVFDTFGGNNHAKLTEPGAGARSSVSQTIDISTTGLGRIVFRYKLTAEIGPRRADMPPDSFTAHLLSGGTSVLDPIDGLPAGVSEGFFYADTEGRILHTPNVVQVYAPDPYGWSVVRLNVNHVSGTGLTLEYGLACGSNGLDTTILRDGPETQAPNAGLTV